MILEGIARDAKSGPVYGMSTRDTCHTYLLEKQYFIISGIVLDQASLSFNASLPACACDTDCSTG